MIRGTTPTHSFTIPFETNLIKEVRVIYSQRGNIILEKKTEDCILEGKQIVVHLTQEETFSFSHTLPVELQVRVLTIEGTALACTIKQIDVDKVLSEEVLE